MCDRRPAAVFLALTLAACTLTKERREREERIDAEEAFLDGIATGSVETARRALATDRTLANAFRYQRSRSRRYKRETALTFALAQGRREMVDLLLEFGADPNLEDANGILPLYAALLANKDSMGLVTLLLEKGADPLRSDAKGATALHYAAELRDGSEALALLLAKAKGTGGADARGATPLHRAARSAEEPAIRLLVEKGADVNARTGAPRKDLAYSEDVAGATPLAIVARDRQIRAAATLCALGADPDVPDSTGASARAVAARVAAAEGARPNPTQVDLVRHQNMAAFLATGGGCDALRARREKHEALPAVEVRRIANESECAAGWGWACGQAGWAYYQGEGAPRSAPKALALFRTGCGTALTPDGWCCGMAGILYLDGAGAATDPAEALRWLSKGCDTPDPRRADAQACHRLGLAVSEGRGVPQDPGRARAAFQRACNLKYEEACARLADGRPLP